MLLELLPLIHLVAAEHKETKALILFLAVITNVQNFIFFSFTFSPYSFSAVLVYLNGVLVPVTNFHHVSTISGLNQN